jgi:integrating conjugative element protein (TIGR03752 family)
MAVVLESSPFLRLISYVGGVVIIVLLVNVFTAGDNNPSQGVHGNNPPSVVVTEKAAIDDSMSETLEAVSQQLGVTSEKFEKLRISSNEDNDRLRAELDELKKSNETDNIDMDKLTIYVNNLVNKKINSKNNDQLSGSSSMHVESDINDIILNENDDITLGGYVVGAESENNSNQEYEWTYPVGEKETESGLFDGFMNKTNAAFDISKELASNSKSKIDNIQYATIDKEAILYDAIILTELVGVVASSSTVKSPFNFKLELGQDNLATSGIYMPHLAEIRMSGYGVGEWVTSCVQGIITSATFVFSDGTISNAVVGKDASDQGSGSGNQGQIGYITDEYGSPCIKGDKYSDLAEYASVTGGLSVLSGIGSAVSNAQYDTQSSATQVNKVFTGDIAKSIGGEGLEVGANAFNQVMASRYKNIRDLIVADAGQYVTVHLSKQLDIDYNPIGRKVLNKNFEEELNEYYEQQNSLYDNE